MTEWATRTLGLSFAETGDPAWRPLVELVRPGLRRNPKRAHLLVSTVLGKHIPADPRVVIEAGERLGDLVAVACPGETVVLGFAETATSLGHIVAHRLNAATYLHSTRRPVPAEFDYAHFEEGHSHATSHTLAPTSPELFGADLPLVLVDDEISTGSTALDAIAALHAVAPRSHYVVASLVDMRSSADRDRVAAVERSLGVRIDTVALAYGTTMQPDDLIDAVAALDDPVTSARASQPGSVRRVDLDWPRGVPIGGRFGFTRSDYRAFDAAVAECARNLRAGLTDHVTVLGYEELMYAPLRIAEELTALGLSATFHTTTRSPAYTHDDAEYPLRQGLSYASPELTEGSQTRYVYNVTAPGAVLLVVDAEGDTDRLLARGGLLDALTCAGHDVVLAVLPAEEPAVIASAR